MSCLKTIFRVIPVALVVFLFSSCSDQGSKGFFVKSLDNWEIQSSDSIRVGAKEISSAGFDNRGLYPANVPSTVLHALVQNNVYKDIFKDDNLNRINSSIFNSPWWYRTGFDIDGQPETVLLHFDGINYKANIWLNGVQIADTSQVKNAFRQFSFNILDKIRKGRNFLAVEVFPPVKGDFSIGFVDWNPAPPDNNMGIFRPVYIEVNGGIGISKPFVASKLSEDLSEAVLTASVEVTNYSDENHKGEIVMIVNGNRLSKPVEIKANESKKILFTTKEFSELNIKNPQLWWPHTLGIPHLYSAGFEFHYNGVISDRKSIDFGIRTVSDFFTKDGHRGFKINGKKILIRGGGWVDRLLLDDTKESIRHQLEYVKDMNLNTIRLEGFWGKDQTLYNLCDKMGILVMVGWSCHWEWEDYLGKYCDEEFGGILSDNDVDMMSKAWQDQIIWLRNHPSIFSWLGGSDCKPKPELEKRYMKTFTEYDSTRVYLPSAKEWQTPTGHTGVKMRGPYAYEPPVYWFADTLYGGAFGFNTETGPGAQVPPLESIKKMISSGHLWPIDTIWNFHCGRYEFDNLDRYTTALEARYGKITGIEDFAKKAQVMNYELMRPMFEAFSAYRYKATGVIQWMLNSAWPEMYWQLYDYYLMPNGAYYGTKKASQPYHAVYDYSENSIFLVNDRLNDKNGCTLKVKVYDINSVLKFDKDLKADLKANSSIKVLKMPGMKWNSPVYFIDTRLLDESGNEIDNNFYWISAKPDILDYEADVEGWYYHTPSKQYADYEQLSSMPLAEVVNSFSQSKEKEFTEFAVTLKNKSRHIAFFIHTEIIDGKTGNAILPVLWSDNYVSLLPGEVRVLNARIRNKYLKNKKVRLSVDGYNIVETE